MMKGDHTHGIFVLVPQFLLKGLVSVFWKCTLQGHPHWAWLKNNTKLKINNILYAYSTFESLRSVGF